MSDEQKELSREELLSAREERRLELQQRFNPEKMKVVRKGYFPDDIANTFGVPVEEHKRQMEVSELDGLVSFGALTSPQREKKE